MEAESVLLEPWYDVRLELPAAQLGRAMTDLQQLGARLDPPQTAGEEAVLTGAVSASTLGDYARDVAAYTQGRGTAHLRPAGLRALPGPGGGDGRHRL